MLHEPGLLCSVLITALDLAHVHAPRAPGYLRSVLVTALDLAHVHAALANSAMLLPLAVVMRLIIEENASNVFSK